MLGLIVAVVFFALLLSVVYGISLLCLKGVLQIIARGVNHTDIRRPVNVGDQSRLDVRAL
ncbi:MAG TPA: hypothetical protein VE262_03630 [Blastocatellia bacterium]|nr:hypothetical protein [Blastocatellia bacterium]